MSNFNTDRVRDHMSIMGISIPTDDEWIFDTLQKTLNEIDRLKTEPLLSDNEFNETQMKREVEQRTKDAVRDSILENCEPKTEYGPHGLHIEWYTADDIEQAIDSAKVK